MPILPLQPSSNHSRGRGVRSPCDPPSVFPAAESRLPVVRQARYWMCTIPRDDWIPCLPEGAVWCIGQPELGEEGGAEGYRHWQAVVAFPKKISLVGVRRVLPSRGHYEPTDSAKANQYVQKEDTRDGEPFEFGARLFKRNSEKDWEEIRQKAIEGKLLEVPADIFVRYYSSLRRIAGDYAHPVGILRTVFVFWGPTHTGKSHRAWSEGSAEGSQVYGKSPSTKFWCGYRGEDAVVIDEFRGDIGVGHLLRWFDRYPVNVETKGGSMPLVASRIWITSNLHPRSWYPDLDSASLDALLRRLQIVEMTTVYNPNPDNP